MNSTTRRRRAFWGDLRFLIGILLVVASIAGVWFVVTSSRETVPVLQAAHTIIRGEAVTSADFRTVEVRLGVLEPSYLHPDQLQPGSIATRTIAGGELVPAAALAPGSTARTTTIVVSSANGVSETIERGTVVELWVAPPVAETRGYEQPRLLLRQATVASVSAPQGLIAQGGTTLELVIDRVDVPLVLAAIADGSLLWVSPLGGGS